MKKPKTTRKGGKRGALEKGRRLAKKDRKGEAERVPTTKKSKVGLTLPRPLNNQKNKWGKQPRKKKKTQCEKGGGVGGGD